MDLDTDQLTAELVGLAERFEAARSCNIGFPGSSDFDYTAALADLLGRQLLNNVGDPYVDGPYPWNTKPQERWVIDFLARLFRAPDDHWGYVTSCGTESNLYALLAAKSLYPDGIVYHSDAAHPSIDKALRYTGLPALRIPTDRYGQLNYHDLDTQIRVRRQRPAIVIATIGTTMTEAVDDVRVITEILDRYAIRRRFIHADAALAGVPLALLEPADRPGFDFGDGADSITVSGHKFIGSPFPNATVIIRGPLHRRIAEDGFYTGSPDTTIGGSRSGHAPLVLWYRLRRLGLDGLRQRAAASRALAVWLKKGLDDLGWPAHLNPNAFTVYMRQPPEAVCKKWVLAHEGDGSHIVCMPGVTREQLGAFLADLSAAKERTLPA
jgi:histidine decarboxylase